MNQIRLQTIHRSLATPAKPGGSTYCTNMPRPPFARGYGVARRASLFSLESGSFRDDKGLLNCLL